MKETQQIFNDIRHIPTGKSYLRLSQQKSNLSTSLYAFRDLAQLFSQGKLSESETKELNEQVSLVLRNSPSIEHSRMAIEVYTYQKKNNLNASELDLIHALLENMGIQPKEPIENQIEHIQTLPIREYMDRTYLYGMYLLGDEAIRNEIHERLRYVPLNYSYFRLFRWLYTYAETFAIPELFAIITNRIYQSHKNIDTPDVRKHFQDLPNEFFVH